jgi:hypothetical protein
MAYSPLFKNEKTRFRRKGFGDRLATPLPFRGQNEIKPEALRPHLSEGLPFGEIYFPSSEISAFSRKNLNNHLGSEFWVHGSRLESNED